MSNATVTMGMAYRNSPEALDWVCRVLGFENRPALPGPNNTIMHAKLTLGSGMLMMGSQKKVVDDAHGVYGRTGTAGAEMLSDIEANPYSGRAFTCRDLWRVKSGHAG